MLEVLVDAHNRMLQAFCDSNKIRFDDLVELSLCDLAPSHLIVYNTDEKLLPLIRAHARYELQRGHRTQQSFELKSLAQHIQSWLFVARPRIKRKPLIEPIASTYTTSSTLLKLDENIKQFKLNPEEERIILEQCNRLEDVTASLQALDTALGFLTAVHRDPTQPLRTFLKDDIKLNVEFVSQKAMQVCELQHVRDLWFILALRKAVMLTNKEQDGLEWLPQENRVGIDDVELLGRTRDELKRCGRDLLLPLMLRCVVFHTTQDELNYPLKHMLSAVGDDQDMLVPDALMELPEDLKTNQIADVFKEAVQQCKTQN